MRYITITKTDYSELLTNGVIWTKHGLIYFIKALDNTHFALLVKDDNYEKARLISLHWKGTATYQL